jgi:TetR/AcrR family transcriptional repressor of nem operon
LEGAVRRYLSAGHRDHPEAGCALPATITEAAQADEAVRDEVTRELDELAGELEAKAGLSRARALSTLALFVGGIILSRAVPGTRLSDELLEACREAALAAPPE